MHSRKYFFFEQILCFFSRQFLLLEDEQLAYRDQLQQKSVSLKNNINEIQKKITNLNIELTEKSKKLDDAS